MEKPKIKSLMFEFDDEEDDAPGTAGGMAALFQKKNSLFEMSTIDFKKAEVESKKFRNKSSSISQEKKSKKKSSSNNNKSRVGLDASKTCSKTNDINPYEDVRQLEREADELLGHKDDGLLPEYRYDHSLNNQHEDHCYCKKTATASSTSTGLVLMEVDLADCENDSSQEETKLRKEKTQTTVIDVDDEDDDLLIDSQSELGQMIPFYVNLNGENFSLMMYENEDIADLRKKVAKKSGNVDPESLQIFLENTILEDLKTVKESGITDCCTLDVFITNKSDQELYEEGSMGVIKLKMQTSDRRGRLDHFIYVKRTSTMRVVRDSYASLIGVNPASLKLENDGEPVCLNDSPDDCELENEFVIDVTIMNGSGGAE